ncbi:MAG: hypothetical protein CM15mP83_9480 [Flavobacteriaceae bacterium]|nr:MAG: hypothetical protein CM15mP83_9480 [Flavobacteriaceae bacterium]
MVWGSILVKFKTKKMELFWGFKTFKKKWGFNFPKNFSLIRKKEKIFFFLGKIIKIFKKFLSFLKPEIGF